MNKEMTRTDSTVVLIEEMMSMFRTEDKETLLNRIESLLYSLSSGEIIDMHEHYVDTYPEMFPELGYDESEVTNDFYENGDPDDCDPAGGYGLNSHK
jgi:hypothetical protein